MFFEINPLRDQILLPLATIPTWIRIPGTKWVRLHCSHTSV